MENEILFEDGTRKTICTISTRSKTLWELSRRIYATGQSHEAIYRMGLLAMDGAEKEGEK